VYRSLKVVELVNEGLSSGVFRVALAETLHLNLLGVDSVLLTGYSTGLEHYFKMKTRVYTKLSFRHSLPVSYIGSFLRDFTGSIIEPKIPDNFKPDWIICHNLSPIYDAFRLSAKTGASICVVIHNPTYPPSPFNIFLRLFGLEEPKYVRRITKLLQCVDLVVTTSMALTRSFLQKFGIRSEILQLACDPLEKVPEHRGDFVLCASRISLGKRVDQVAKIIDLVDRNYPVVFAGSTHATTSEVVRRIKKTSLRNYKFAFNIPDKLLDELYARCRFFMGFSSGLPPLEAESHGAPIVCDNASWAGEYFIDRVHGYMYKNEDELFSRCPQDIETLMLDERKAWKMGFEGWKLCRERYTWTHHTKTLVSLLCGSKSAVSSDSE